MASEDYVGRTIDLWAFQAGIPSTPLPQSLFIPVPGYICTGIEKLTQRWLIEFQTIVGSMPFLPDRGCSFMAAFKAGQLQTEADVFAEFDFSAAQIATTLRAETPETAPADEQLQRAELTELAILDDRLNLQISLTSLAGTARRVIMPISFSVISTS